MVDFIEMFKEWKNVYSQGIFTLEINIWVAYIGRLQ